MVRYKLEPKRMRLVYPYVDKEPNMVLIEGCRGGKSRMTVETVSYTHLGYQRGAVLSTRGPGWTDRWCICWIPDPWQSSQVRQGKTLKASKREAPLRMRYPIHRECKTP